MQFSGSANKGVYVAIVDDDASLCHSFSRLLRAAGFQAIAYSSAEAFLQDAKRPRFDRLVLDIQLEGMSGLDAGGSARSKILPRSSLSRPMMTRKSSRRRLCE